MDQHARLHATGYTAVLIQAAVVSLLPVYVGQLLSEVLDLDEFGRFYAFMSVVSLAVYVGGLGLDRVATAEATTALRTGEHHLHRGLRALAPWLILAASLAVCGVLVGSHLLSGDLDRTELIEFSLIILLVPVIGFVRYLYGATIPHASPVLASFMRDVLVLLVVVGIVIVLAFAGYTDLSVVHATAVYMCGYVGASAGLTLLLRRHEPAEMRRGPRRTETPRWIRTGLTSSMSILVYVFIGTSALLYAKWFLHDDDLAGRIASINQIGGIPMPIALGFARVITPDMMRAIDASDPDAVRAISRRFLRLAGPPLVLITVLTIAFMRPILYWYGPEYLAAAPAAIVLVLGSAISAALMAASTVSNLGPDLHRRTLVATVITVLGVASFPLLPTGSLLGLAAAQAGIMLACTIAVAMLGHRRLRRGR